MSCAIVEVTIVRATNRTTLLPPSTPYPLQKLLAAHLAARRLLPLHQLPLDHHLRRDAGVIGAGLPQHVLAAQALEAAEDALQRFVERMANMQGPRHIRRGDDKKIAPGPRALGPAGAERARL